MFEKKIVNASYGLFLVMLVVGLILCFWIPDDIGIHNTWNKADSIVSKWSYSIMFPLIALGFMSYL